MLRLFPKILPSLAKAGMLAGLVISTWGLAQPSTMDPARFQAISPSRIERFNRAQAGKAQCQGHLCNKMFYKTSPWNTTLSQIVTNLKPIRFKRVAGKIREIEQLGQRVWRLYDPG